jgi:hypothetical protein
MANAAVASWSKSIKEVQKIFDDPVTATVTRLGVDGLLHKLGLATEFVPGGTALPNAAWKKLVQDVQVISNHMSTAGCNWHAQWLCVMLTRRHFNSFLYFCKARQGKAQTPTTTHLTLMEM